MKPLETGFVFASGALGYWALELLWRGHTHWTMPITGGLCMIIIYAVANFMFLPLWQKWILSAACITAVEFVTGGIVNIILGWNVWNYSNMPLNLMGQICPQFTFAWVILSIPCVLLSNILRYFVFMPIYRRGAHSP